jgi:RHH-type proline utilization regulon transcriptional repressor/proline dehydrogenase/delta 1-pyrroline-5-carboxylate dehydrogenase
MRRAIEQRRLAPPGKYPLQIGDDAVPTGEWDAVSAPGHPGLLLGRVARAELEHVDRAVLTAAHAFESWRAIGWRKRAAILRRAAEIMAERRFELAAVEVFECAKPWNEADGDITEAIDFLRYYAMQAEELAEPRSLTPLPGETNYLVHEPRGVAAIIAPWNFPLAILTGMTAGALAAGCPAILKPAEQSPVVAAHLVKILREAGVATGAVQYLPGPGEVIGDALVKHRLVAMIAFTGSNAVGKQIMVNAAEVAEGQPMLKRVIAELGGKNALVIDDDADLDQAVMGTITSAFGYAGQKCSACSRVIVVGSAYEEFRARLAAAVESLAAGYPEDPRTTMPPVISVEACEGIERYIELGNAEGRLVAKGPAFDAPTYVLPHVFEDLPRESRLLREEIFGPVLALMRAGTFAEAIDMAMDSPFALTGGIYSRNPRNIALAKEQFRVGNFYVNRPITGSMVGRQPFAGFKMSGTGEKAGGPDYVRQFTVPRVVTENTVRRGFAPDDE